MHALCPFSAEQSFILFGRKGAVKSRLMFSIHTGINVILPMTEEHQQRMEAAAKAVEEQNIKKENLMKKKELEEEKKKKAEEEKSNAKVRF